MVQIHVNPDTVRISIRGLHKIWAMADFLEIPLASIDFVEQAAAFARAGPAGTRNPGTSIPYLLNAGSFNAGVSRSFWDVHNPKNAIRIKLNAARGLFASVADHYDEVVVEVANPVDTVGEITRALDGLNRMTNES